MAESETDISSGGHDEPSTRRRLLGYCIRLALASLMVFALYRGPNEYHIWKIRSVGGVVVIGKPSSYLYHRIATFLPPMIARSHFFGRLFFKPRVCAIDLRDVPTSGHTTAAIQAAANFPAISSITLYQSGATDEDVAFISRSFPALTDLKLNETSISDGAIGHLKSLPRLRALNIQRTGVTDAAIDDLVAIPSLKELNIGETQITDIARLSKSCYVTHRLVTRKRTTDYYRVHGQ